MPTELVAIDQPLAHGRLVGRLAATESVDEIARVLFEAPQLIERGAVALLGVGDASTTAGRLEVAKKRDSILRRRAHRYTVQVDTKVGRRIVKVAEVRKVGNALLGLLGTSLARKEHAAHSTADAFGVAASQSLGFLEWRRGPVLVRACQVQTPVDASLTRWDHFLARELIEHGDAALEPAAQAIAALHARQFFHADLKGYHGYVVEPSSGPGPQSYGLRFIDLARIGFRLSRRRRIINLYQALRFLVPPRPEAHQRFMQAYTRASGWHADAPERGLAVVHRFLAHKYETLPLV